MTESTAPRTKAARQEAIRSILASYKVTSQEDLRSQLAANGIEVTQTTLSRDLIDMHAAKVRSADGALVYTVPDADGLPTHEGEAGRERLARWCQSLLTSLIRVNNQLVLRTPVGAAQLLGSAIDSVRMSEVAGTLAGDDTVLVICRCDEAAVKIEAILLEMTQSSSLTEK
ncbi:MULTISPECIES: arginine repressor [unclassified Schaalia]|uniref:arginine repressor n=1 Tax=unclassified Schaalia TaxID=2691889 RepID=UPI001E60BCDB|nr:MULTISPECIES: arginine repressor [unclassified Schaalia]MCD4550149.1 arginine repressor [Schaalia sp. lx-260]MCD4557431.1 arginine repressor [Schaalia sp. lx-100]